MKDIQKKHVFNAFAKIKSEGIPPRLKSTRYDVFFEGVRYPPKQVMREAQKISEEAEAQANEVRNSRGEPWWPYGGGPQTNRFLEEFGFKIVPKKGNYKQLKVTWKRRKKRESQQQNSEQGYFEGQIRTVSVEHRKRDSKARRQILNQKGYDCEVCGFNFEKTYGVKFSEVHHLKPLSVNERITNPKTDLLVVCSNCHTMLHPSAKKVRNWKELKKMVNA
jgi:5-methylcytosine-specific restriction endonuclease McrA